MSELGALFQRKAGRAYEKFYNSEQGQELLAKANEYHIPYNKERVDFFALSDQICEYESLIAEATEHNIDWECFEYDPVGLQQEIEYAENAARESDAIAYYGFYNNVNLGV